MLKGNKHKRAETLMAYNVFLQTENLQWSKWEKNSTFAQLSSVQLKIKGYLV